jgi:hypothetical protein
MRINAELQERLQRAEGLLVDASMHAVRDPDIFHDADGAEWSSWTLSVRVPFKMKLGSGSMAIYALDDLLKGE